MLSAERFEPEQGPSLPDMKNNKQANSFSSVYVYYWWQVLGQLANQGVARVLLHINWRKAGPVSKVKTVRQFDINAIRNHMLYGTHSVTCHPAVVTVHCLQASSALKNMTINIIISLSWPQVLTLTSSNIQQRLKSLLSRLKILCRFWVMWWTLLLGWYFPRRGATTLLRSFASCIGSKHRSGVNISSPSSLTSVCRV